MFFKSRIKDFILTLRPYASVYFQNLMKSGTHI
jgi:hypothetical protein